jgi:adenylate cyclase
MAQLTCGSCGTQLRQSAKFCDECGTPIATHPEGSAEYKQVTVLFADVVRSMDIAASVDIERLREIMSELLRRCTDVVRRYGGTVDKFTGDGIMALFGAPVALEDHAFRACLAALAIHQEAEQLAAAVERRDGIALRLRVGLNSGQVIAGAVGSGSWIYTALGEQVGMAQRMESAARPGGILVSEWTARLVQDSATLSAPELIGIKGRDEPVVARHLLGIGAEQSNRIDSRLIGRQPEIAALRHVLDAVIGGNAAVVNLVGPAGIGKSRVAREVATIASNNGVQVFRAAAESHATDIPLNLMTRLLRSVYGVDDLDGQSAVAKLKAQTFDADEHDVLLLSDLLGKGVPDPAPAAMDPDARRRRLTALIARTLQERTQPALYVVEDAQWIDEISESMLADLAAMTPHSRSMLLITYRPEYRGALTKVANTQVVALDPLPDADSAAMISELLGADPSVAAVSNMIAARAAGNPFFTEEIIRDLSGREVLRGHRGAYVCTTAISDISVPATLQATIASRIDRLHPAAKRALSAAAVIGQRFSGDLLVSLGVQPVVNELVEAEMIDEVIHLPVHDGMQHITPLEEYTFHHPLIHAVAYESQLKSDRAELHRRLAALIEARGSDAADQNAARIAEHLEAAGELPGAYAWQMRAGTWSAKRDITAARLSWQRACQVADRLPGDDHDARSMRIAPRAMLCASAWHVGGNVADAGFDELRGLCSAKADKVALAVGMAGLVMALATHNQIRHASQLANEFTALLESIGDSTLLIGMSHCAIHAKYQAGEMAEALRLTQQVIDLADGDPTRGNVDGNLIVGSPLALAIAMRSIITCCLGMSGWRQDADEAVAVARGTSPMTYVLAIMYKYFPVMFGAMALDADALQDTAVALRIAEQSGDNFTLGLALFARGLVLIHHDCDCGEGMDHLAKVRELSNQQRLSMTVLPAVNTYFARAKADNGDLDAAIALSRKVVDGLFASGEMLTRGVATATFVELLLRRGRADDLTEARTAIARLAAVPTDPGFVLHELPLLRLRALLARAHADHGRFRHYAERYRALATSIGFEGHMALAGAMS